MPNSFSLPFNLFLEKHKNKEGQEYSTFLHPDKVKKALEDAVGTAEASKIISGERPVVTSCGSGMTAGVLWLGLKLLGVKQIGLYDEVRPNLPVGDDRLADGHPLILVLDRLCYEALQ